MLSSALASMAVKLLAETFSVPACTFTKHCVRSGVQVGLGLGSLPHGNQASTRVTWYPIHLSAAGSEES
jgi:hypothetical protein